MSVKINLADPDFEPTDEQLADLMKRAFADVAAENRQALSDQKLRIEKLRAELRGKLASKLR